MLTTIHDEPAATQSTQDTKTAAQRHPQELPVPMLNYMKHVRNIDKQDQVNLIIQISFNCCHTYTAKYFVCDITIDPSLAQLNSLMSMLQ